jgi:hypothetical protein
MTCVEQRYEKREREKRKRKTKTKRKRKRKRQKVIYVCSPGLWLPNYDADNGSEPENPITITFPEGLPRAIFAFVTVDGVNADADDEIAEAEGR